MIEAQRGKYVAAIPPAAILDAAPAVAVAIDTEGYDYLEVMLSLGATDIAVDELKLTECDASGGTYTDLAGTVFGTDAVDIEGNAATLPTDADSNDLVVFQANLLGKKRFVKVAFTAGNGVAGTYASAVARLSRGDMPATNAESGALVVVRSNS